jgi:NADPH2:quinone reductase
MLAIEISRHGGPGALRPVKRPDPVPRADELVVRNRWIGVNYVDLQHREGRPYPVELPLVPGIEAAGEVVATGPDADAALIGRPVVHFGHLARGGAVVQLAAAAGATVIGLASTPAKAAAARALGAAHAFALSETPDPVGAVLGVTSGAGAAHVYDAGGRDSFDASLAMLATRGTLLLYGQSSGTVEPFDPGRLSGITGEGRAGSLTVRWVSASNDYVRTGADRARALATILEAVAAGRFDARIAGRFELARAAEAHERLASRGILGKLLLRD